MIKCRNLKICLSVIKPIYVKSFRETNSSYILKYFNVSVTVYKHSMNSLHITGIRNKNDLHLIFYFVSHILKNRIKASVVNNSLFSFKNREQKCSFDFKKVLRTFKNEMYGIKYNPEVFPALFLRSKFKKNGYPTILIFRTGSFVILGGKSMTHIRQANALAQSIIK